MVIDRFGYRIFLRLLCIFAIFTVFSSAITNPVNVIGQTDNFQSHSYNDLGISLKKPFDWAFVSLKNGLQLIEEKDAVYLEIRKSNSQPSNTTLEQLANNDIQERYSSRKDFQLLNLSKTIISGNLPAYKAVYEFLKTQNENSPTSEGATNKVSRITTFANGVAYIVKYVSEKDKYDTYLPIAEKIIDSLKFNVQEKNPNGYDQCLDNGNIAPCISDDGRVAYYCDDPRSRQAEDAGGCMPSPKEWANFLPSCNSVNFKSSCTSNGVLMWSCDDPEFNFKKYPQGCMKVSDDVKPKSDNNNQKSIKLKECFSGTGTNPPPCILADESIAYNCNDDRHFKSQDEQCIYWNKSTNSWDLRLKLSDNNNSNSNKGGKITVGYGDVGSYYGKGKIVIKNLDTGQTLVTEDLNFAKQHNNQGDNCCVKVYTFDDSRTHNGDRISAIVTGGGGSWETAPYDYKKNLRISMSLEEIGEDDYESNISNNNDTNDNNSNNDNDNIVSAEAICDSDDSTSAPSCDDFLKEQVKDNDHNDNNDNDYQEEFELPPEEEPEFEDEVTGNISSS